MNASANPEKVAYRPSEVQGAYGICKTKLYELINTGQLKTVRIGRARLILRASLDALLQSEAA